MLDGNTKIAFELTINAQKIVSQYLINNEDIKDAIQKGIEQAFTRFDFVEAVETATAKALHDKIKAEAINGEIDKAIREEIMRPLKGAIDKYAKDFIFKHSAIKRAINERN